MRGDAPTIAAIASPPGGGVRGIIRVSGPASRALVLATWGSSAAPPDLARRGLYPGRFRDARGEQPQILLWMPAPRSFTREDVAEFHLSGSKHLLSAALARLLELGASPAPPGEFTRRAFLSGRIDLTRAQGVLELVRSRDETERRAAAALLFGGLADRVGELRRSLEDLRSLCEASLDFDPADTGHVPTEELERGLNEIVHAMRRASDWEARRGAPGGTRRVVLCGAANAGKSTLFNALCGREEALVSDWAGTTRDALSTVIECGGATCTLFDTAGFDVVAQGPDADAQEFALGAREAADLVLWVVDAGAATRESFARERFSLPAATATLLVWNKVDRSAAPGRPPAEWLEGTRESVERREPSAEASLLDWVATAGRTGFGLEVLRERISVRLATATGCEGAAFERAIDLRHKLALDRAVVELEEGSAAWRAGAPLELLAEHLGRATEALDEVTGETTPERILDAIFSRFCIGK